MVLCDEIHLRIQVDAAIQFHLDVFGRSVTSGEEGYVGGMGQTRERDVVGIIGGIVVGQAVGIEVGIAIAAVGAGDHHASDGLPVLQNHDGPNRIGQVIAPHGRHLRNTP